MPLNYVVDAAFLAWYGMGTFGLPDKAFEPNAKPTTLLVDACTIDTYVRWASPFGYVCKCACLVREQIATNAIQYRVTLVLKVLACSKLTGLVRRYTGRKDVGNI